MKKLYLTNRALDDIQDIYDFSFAKWNEKTALRYIRGFEECFSLLKNNQGLLKVNKKISSRFIVYPVQKHFLICDIINDAIYVLTIKHTSMNLWERLKKLKPTLNQEASALYNRINGT